MCVLEPICFGKLPNCCSKILIPRWLYGKADNATRQNAPLIMWLQGGPGASGTGFGNFMEIGPLDINLKPRQYSWVESANLIFVDNPVGTGYSYVDNPSLLTTNEDQIAADLVTLLKAVVTKYTSLQNNPFWIFSESYGGKMTASFAAALHKAIGAGKINVKLGGAAMGDSWIEPMAFVNNWGPYLYTTGQVDYNGKLAVCPTP